MFLGAMFLEPSDVKSLGTDDSLKKYFFLKSECISKMSVVSLATLRDLNLSSHSLAVE